MHTPAGKASLVLVGGLLGLAALTAVLTRGGQRGRDVSSRGGACVKGGASGAGGAAAANNNARSLSHTRHTTISKLRKRIEFREELSFGATGKVLRARYRKSQCVCLLFDRTADAHSLYGWQAICFGASMRDAVACFDWLVARRPERRAASRRPPANASTCNLFSMRQPARWGA